MSSRKPDDPITWYPGGPIIYQLSFPVIVEDVHWAVYIVFPVEDSVLGITRHY